MDPLSGDLLVPSPQHPVDVGLLVQRTHRLLAAGVPLTLLIDLADDSGPHSVLRYASEGGDADWLPELRA